MSNVKHATALPIKWPLVNDRLLLFLLLNGAICQRNIDFIFNLLLLKRVRSEHERGQHGALSTASIAHGKDQVGLVDVLQRLVGPLQDCHQVF